VFPMSFVMSSAIRMFAPDPARRVYPL
jgi:hypothetical protein